MNSEKHIASVFDRDLEAIQAMIMKMGGLVEAAILDAAQALETRDEELAETVRNADKAVDALEEQINTEAARLIALRAPTAGDLRTVLTVMKIATGLERCGDYAKNLAKRSTVLVQMAPIGDTAGGIRRMAKAVEQLVKDALDSYIHRDVERAEDVRQRDKEVDQMYNRCSACSSPTCSRIRATSPPACTCISSRRTSNAWAITPPGSPSR